MSSGPGAGQPLSSMVRELDLVRYREWMDPELSEVELGQVEREMARLDAVYRPVATAPLRPDDLSAVADLGARIGAELAALGVNDRAEAVLHQVIGLYDGRDEATRATIRGLFDRYPSFRWAAHLPWDWATAVEFRARLIHLSARDQGADTRDEILALQDLCERAGRCGVDVGPILAEVAAISSDVDRYGMGSMRSILLRYGG